MERVKEACKPDVEKFCKEIKPGDGRIAACLKSHDSELAPACHQIVDKVESAIHEAHEACKSDAEKLCQGIEPGGGRIRACLKSHEAELSEACKAVFDHRGKPAK
jgi:phage host-nuclease inhibitor protein Gam